ncbi:LysR family transcriptional regulator [Pseudooceanicola sp. CBS1P-1]|uniref:LysR family transcriptional regulator n=1 Tax=Pseudooceanicola albus TaxID=2692189 RepID=A0A6L7G5S7_9RHOB|nr:MULTISPECIES: LysR family transcriptional regulator [Pseudooceanicola]MBT9386184.1 LysR family transcriptional regulator [Pseudooceanicola endophyticus]MXN19401.1 LysR family transcriptional regulator [Pseudooceanicola albus]
MTSQITLKQLETLYWIARLGTFDRAAARLYTSQSAVSKRIAELERSSGIEIFDRSARGARMTPRGEELYEIAREMLEMQDRIQGLRTGEIDQPRHLRIGVTELTAMTWLPRLITGIQHRFGQTRLSPKVDMSRNLFAELEQDQLDLIIVPRMFSLPDFVSVPLREVGNTWMARRGLLDEDRVYSLLDLAEHPMLIQGRQSGSGLFYDKWMRNQGIRFPSTLVCDSMTALLGLVVAGLGISYLPNHCFQSLVEDGKLSIVQTDTPLPAVPYVAMYRQDRPHAFIHQVAEMARDCANFDQSYQA